MINPILATKYLWVTAAIFWALQMFPDLSAAQFAGGAGIDEDPYLVETLEQLQSIADSIHLDKHFIQIADIDASETIEWNDSLGFEPIGWYVNWETKGPFTGSYNGNGFNIEDLYINRPDEDEVGLFGYIENGTIQNIALIDNAVYGNRRIGGLAGYVRSGYVSGSYATGITSGAYNNIGGLIGENAGEIINSYAHGEVSGESAIGGLVGFNIGGKIDSSYATGYISGGDYIGGLVGRSGSNSPIRKSYATGAVSGDNYVGGLIGANNDDIDESYATGAVSGDSYIGGLVGHNTGGHVFKLFASGNKTDTSGPVGVSGFHPVGGQIDRSYARGSVSGGDFVGGLVGQNDENGPSVKKSFATGDVSGVNEVGGLIGQNKGNVTDAFTTSEVTGSEMTGGFIGSNVYAWVTIHRSYWNTTVTDQSEGVGEGESTGIKGLATEQMTGEDAFIHMYKLDFSETWQLTEGYPVLSWQEPVDAVEPPEVPIVSVTPETVNYGEVEMGSAQSMEVILRNKGTVTMNGEVLPLETEATVFEIIRGEGEWTLEPDSSRIIEISFQPSGEDTFQADLDINHGAPNEDDPMVVTLTGRGKTATLVYPDEPLPQRYELRQNYPNPFNPATIIPFELPESSAVRLEIYDLLGRQVAIITDLTYEAGRHEVSWNPSAAASGVYIVRMTVINSQGQHLQFNRQVTLLK